MSESMVKAYATYNKDNSIRKESSSGGAFSAFAEYIINHNGVVYGVKMSDDCYYAEYIRIKTKEDIEKIRGSKYVQAKMGDTLCKVKNDLDNGLTVLFSGTGCQVNGLKSFLGREYKNLYCIDVVCHGVPSQLLWKKYIDNQEQRFGKVLSVDFRCKNKRWEKFGVKEKSIFISKSKDSFFRIFLRDYGLRPSCYNCYAKTNKQSDISLADFWGINKVSPEMNDNKGVSLVLVRTEKGKYLYRECSKRMISKEVDYSEAIKYNPAELHSANRPEQRRQFYNDLYAYSFGEIIRKYIPKTSREIIDEIERCIKKIAKRILNRITSARRGKTSDVTSEYGILLIVERKKGK